MRQIQLILPVENPDHLAKVLGCDKFELRIINDGDCNSVLFTREELQKLHRLITIRLDPNAP